MRIRRSSRAKMRAGCLLVASSWAAAAAMMLFAAGFVRTSCGRAIGTGRQSVILLLKDAETVWQARKLCGNMDHEVASEADVIDRKDSGAAAVADVVWALRTASACKLQEGLSGDFSSSDIEALQDCLPPGSILSVEVDSKVRHAESLVSSRAATAMLEAKQGMNSDGQPVHLRRVASQDLHRRTMRMAPSSRVSEGQRGRQLKFQHNTTLERRGSASAEYSEKNQIDDAAPWGSLSLRGPSLASVLSSAVGLGTRFNGPAWESGFMISGDRLVRTAIKISQGFSLSELNVRPYDDHDDEKEQILWNLDRLDQRSLPLDKEFDLDKGCHQPSGSGSSAESRAAGQGVTVYVLDSGVNIDHQEFAAEDASGSRAMHGYDFVDDDEDSSDCNGHGTHVASSVIGRMVGVAREAQVVSVRVLDCKGDGKIRDVIAGLEWVTRNAEGPSVITMSLGVPLGSWSSSLDSSIKAVVNDHRITVIVASGNSRTDSCFISPAYLSDAITVSASRIVDSGEGEASNPNRFREGIYSHGNYGSCVDLFAPGVNIFGACGGPGRCSEVLSDAYTLATGTSMAVPHVAGVAALYLSRFPHAGPQEVKDAILKQATRGVFDASTLVDGTPNLMLYAPVACGNYTEAAWHRRF